MKKYLLIGSVLFLASCNEQEMFERQSILQDDFRITASMEDYSDSRTTFEGEAGGANRRVLWQENDALTVFMGSANENSKFTLAEGANTAFASFQGNVHIWGGVEGEEVGGFANVAYYPYTENVIVTYDANGESYTLSTTFPAEQQYAPNASFAQNVSPMVAVTKNKGSYAFMFKNVASWVNLYVKGTAKVTKVVMKATNDYIAGDYIVTAKNGSDPVAAINENGKFVKEITIDCGDEGVQLSKDEATVFTFTTIPFEFDANEVSFDIYGEGVYMKDAYVITKASSFVRSKYHGVSEQTPVEFIPNSAVEGETVQAILNGKGYATLTDAIAAAGENDVITILEGDFDLAAQLNTTSGQPNKSVTIKGAGIDKTNLTSPKTTNDLPGTYANNLTLKFEDLTYTSPGGYSSGFGAATSVEFVGCKIVGEYYAQSWAPHTFTDCIIDPQNGYLYTWASNCDFEGCTFSASEGKALQIFNSANDGEYTVNITNCKFVAAKQATTYDGKPVTGIDVNSTNSPKITVNIDAATTTTGFPKGQNSGTDLWNVKNLNNPNITVNVDNVEVYPNYGYKEVSTGVYNVWSVKGLSHFSDVNQSNVTLNITDNIDFEGAEFKAIPVGRNASLTINGNGYTISNVKVVSGSDDNTTGQASMFYPYDGSTLNISNLKFDNIQVSADDNDSGYAAVVVGYAEGAVTMDNVDVTNAAITGAKSSGMLVGHLAANGSLIAKNCDVSGTITLTDYESGGHYAGEYIGSVCASAELTTCTANVTISGNVKETNFGTIYGRIVDASLKVDGAQVVNSSSMLTAAIAASNSTILLADGTYEGCFDIKDKSNITLQALNKDKAEIKGLVYVTGSNVKLQGLKLSNPSAVKTSSCTTGDLIDKHVNGNKPIVGVYVNSTVDLEKCTFDLSGDVTYGFYAYASTNATFTNCVFECGKKRPIASNGDKTTVTGCTFNNQYHYSLRLFENSGNKQTVVFTNNTIKGSNDKDEFEGINFSRKGTPATILGDFTIKGNTADLKYRYHKEATMSTSCKYDTDIENFAFEQEQ